MRPHIAMQQYMLQRNMVVGGNGSKGTAPFNENL
jgi:hypothetical protein